MKKFYAIMMAAALATGAQAQVTERFYGPSFTKFSDDAEWLVQNLQGTLGVVRRSTGDQWESYDLNGLKLYMAGLGHSVTNDGYIVGMAGDSAAVWHDGEWTPLPQPTGVGTSYNTGHSITPDGRRICGVLGNNGASMTGQDAKAMAYPVVWTKNGAGEYEVETLPYPEKDFLGMTPQYVTAVAMSNDGRTVVGQVRDYSGFYVIPIVWSEAQDGTWSYRLVGSAEVYHADKLGELPEMPTAPTMPNANDYMTADDVDAYNAALEKYNEDVTKYFNGELDEYPEYPLMQDYISDPDQKAAYLAALDQYQKDQQQYMLDYTDYMTKRDEIVTNKSFVQNTLCLSGSGRWLGVTLEDRGQGGGDMWGSSTTSTSGLFDLTEQDPQYQAVNSPGSWLTTSALDDGTLLYATPASAYTRTTFVSTLEGGKRANVTFADYVYGINPEAGKWIEDNNTYDVALWDYNDNWEYVVVGTVEDSLVTGTVMANSTGDVFVSYYTDDLTEESDGNALSYIVDLTASAGIHATGAARKGDDGETRLYNLQGQRIQTAPASGLYIEERGGKAVKRVAK